MLSPEIHPQPTLPRVSAVERIHDPEILPIEVGDLWVDGEAIRDRMRDWGFAPALRRAIEIMHAGAGATRSNGPLPAQAAGFEAVLLAGGMAKKDELSPVLGSLPCDLHFSAANMFAGVKGGFALLERRGLDGWVMDLGHSYLKLATRDRLVTFARDRCRLLPPNKTSDKELPAQRRRLREFIALHLQLLLAEAPCPPQALVGALPARLGNDGTPGACDYAGLRGYRDLIPDAMELAGLQGMPAFVLNDAELAAFSARVDPRLSDARKILVLTLGFGIGAALVNRRPISSMA